MYTGRNSFRSRSAISLHIPQKFIAKFPENTSNCPLGIILRHPPEFQWKFLKNFSCRSSGVTPEIPQEFVQKFLNNFAKVHGKFQEFLKNS